MSVIPEAIGGVRLPTGKDIPSKQPGVDATPEKITVWALTCSYCFVRIRPFLY